MANKKLCISILIVTIVSQAISIRAVQYKLLDKDGVNWEAGVEYQSWVDSKSFIPGDFIEMRYKKGETDVTMFNDQAAADGCCFEKNVWQSGCGWANIALGTETLWITSSLGEACKNGMKFKVVPKQCPPP